MTTTSFQNKEHTLIHQIVQQAFQNSYLTLEAEDQLRWLLQTTKYSQEDIKDFMKLQLATMSGLVRQQSRELRTQRKMYQPL